MSDRMFERALHDWLDDGSDRTPPAAIDAVLLAVKTTPQERVLWIPRRFTSMPTYLRLAAGIAAVAILGVAGLTLFNGPGPGGPRLSPTPGSSPIATATPTQSIVEVGTITLTDDGCTWTDNPGSISATLAPVIGRLSVINETETFGNFGVYRLAEGHTWEEAESWISDMNTEFHGGPAASAPADDFSTDVGNIDAPSRGQYPATLTLDDGVHGIVCSANEPPPGRIFAVYLVGPLEVAVD